MTSASASSPSPPVDTTRPSPHWPWTTRSPTSSPSCSAPVEAGARRRRPLASKSPSGGETPLPKTERPGVPARPSVGRPAPEVADAAGQPAGPQPRSTTTSRTSSAGISLRKRLGMFELVLPHSIRLQAWET